MQKSGQKSATLFSVALLWLALSGGVGAIDDRQSPVQASRNISGNIIVSETNPSLAVQVDQNFSYLGRHPITIGDVAAGERFVFAELSGTNANRLFIVQFEGFLPGIEDEYRYNLSNSPIVAGYPFRSNAYSFDLAQSVANNPGGESASTNKFLKARGLAAPKLWMMWRSLTVASADKRHEMILFYVEDAATHGMTMDDIYDPVTDRDTPVWKAMQADLEKRANASFQLAPLDKDKRPVANDWRRLPLRQTP